MKLEAAVARLMSALESALPGALREGLPPWRSRVEAAFAGALTVVAACDISGADIHDNEFVLVADVCALVAPVEPCTTLPVPREEGEPCAGDAPCVSGLLCLCGACLDEESIPW